MNALKVLAFSVGLYPNHKLINIEDIYATTRQF